jgi:TPR repeat protein
LTESEASGYRPARRFGHGIVRQIVRSEQPRCTCPPRWPVRPAIANVTFADAVATHKSGDCSRAFSMFKELAEGEDATSQANLATMYRDGQGTEVDLARAAEWFEKIRHSW